MKESYAGVVGVADELIQHDQVYNKEFVRRYFAALNHSKSAQTIDKYVADAELKHHVELFERAFPGYQLQAHAMIAEGDQVFVCATFTGVHKGDLMGIAPTGKAVEIEIALTYQIAHDKIVAHWMLADQLSMLKQIGVVPQ